MTALLTLLPVLSCPPVLSHHHSPHTTPGVVGAKPPPGKPGLVGVVPGVSVVPLKVINGKGEGALSSLLQAMDYVNRELFDFGVRVSLSLPAGLAVADVPLLVQLRQRSMPAGLQ